MICLIGLMIRISMAKNQINYLIKKIIVQTNE